MFSIPLPTTLESLAEQLTTHYDDVAWLDSPEETGFSILAFGATATESFFSTTPLSAFQAFFERFLLKTQEPPNLGELVLAPLWLGFFSYEAFCFNPLIPFQPSAVKPYPLGVWRKYPTYVVRNKGETHFVSFAENATTLYQNLLAKLVLSTKGVSESAKQQKKPTLALPECQTTWPDYQLAFAQIQKQLQQGDYFELNYTTEFSSHGSLSVSDLTKLYLTLRQQTFAPMMAYFPWPELKILSASPELFFKVSQDGKILTRPIKGTIARGTNSEEDESQKLKLLQSEKECAELLMITDLMRNDFGRICAVGSVVTTKLVTLETFSHYHHLFSEITGTLRNDLSFFDVFCALFPGGSITGAPKIQVMQSIQNLEKRPRGVYTGAIGVISESGWSQFNIPIRTLTQYDNTLEFATGGGIVIDSVVEKEFDECFVKAKGILETLKVFLGLSLCFVIFFGCAQTPKKGSGDFSSVSDDSTIIIRDYSFFPEELEAVAGQTITFYNYDAVPHEILSESAENAFDDTGIFSSEIITPDEFGFIEVPTDAVVGDVYYFYCNQLQDLMVTPNAHITVIADE